MVYKDIKNNKMLVIFVFKISFSNKRSSNFVSLTSSPATLNNRKQRLKHRRACEGRMYLINTF